MFPSAAAVLGLLVLGKAAEASESQARRKKSWRRYARSLYKRRSSRGRFRPATLLQGGLCTQGQGFVEIQVGSSGYPTMLSGSCTKGHSAGGTLN